MPTLGSPAPKARRTLPAAALLLLAGLVIAGVWSVTEAMQAAVEIRRSSAHLAILANLRVALAETPVETTGIERESERSAMRRERRMVRLARRQEMLAAGATDSLALLLRARADASADEIPRLNGDIERHARIRAAIEGHRLEEAFERLETRTLQALFVHLAVGLLALGAAAVAMRHRTE